MVEAIPNPGFLLQLLIAVAFLIWIVLNVAKLWQFFSGDKQVHRAEVTMASEFASASQLKELVEKVEANEATGAARRRAIYEEIKKSGDKTDAKIQSVENKIESVRTEIREDIRGISNLLTDVIRKS